MIGPVAFLAPWLLLGFAALPVLWWLLRAVPPAPGRKAFPGVRLLLGLKDPEKMPERTPWWLLLLRMTALAAAILAFAGPVLNPRPESSGAPLLVLVDGGWGDAPHWAGRMDRAAGALAEAARDGRRAAVVTMTTPPVPGEALPWRAAPEWSERLAGLSPRPWAPDRAAWAAWLADRDEPFETLWLSDGIGHGGEEALARALLAHGPVTLAGPPTTALALTPPTLRDGALTVEALRADAGAARPVGVVALGPDPNGIERALGAGTETFAAGEKSVTLALDMPMELRNRVARIQLAAGKSAASVVLADDTVRRRKVGLMSGRPEGEAQDLVDPLHYLRSALQPFAEVIEAPLPEMLNAAPDVLVLADVGTLGDAERALLVPWVEKGGLLIRFAGPRLAQSGAGQLEDDPLLPVRLRAGGRSIGGAMSWGAPRRLKPFPDNGPFAGLPVPDDVDISSQVMAQPDPDLPDRVMATLEDGTPLVTGRPLGDGRVVLFHVTASADWSSLPLSGLFVRMLERLTQSAGGLSTAAETLAGSVWTPQQVLSGFGELEPPSLVAGVPGERLAEARPSPETPPGIYASGDRRVALNVMRAGDSLAADADAPRRHRRRDPRPARGGAARALARGARPRPPRHRRHRDARRLRPPRPPLPRRRHRRRGDAPPRRRARRAGPRPGAGRAPAPTPTSSTPPTRPSSPTSRPATRASTRSAPPASPASAARSSTARRSSPPTRWRSTSRPTTSRSIPSSTGRSPTASSRPPTPRWRGSTTTCASGG